MWRETCTVEEAEDGESVFVDGERVAIFVVDGEPYAVSDVCTHAGASLTEGGVRDGTVRCPRHGAPFDLRTGEALGPPASDDLGVYDTKVDDGTVYVRVEGETNGV
ncbi:MAG: non-heme iron oxygenase ferredoxin subunit [Halobacteriales archaeon]